jgi:hypothetical protein
LEVKEEMEVLELILRILTVNPVKSLVEVEEVLDGMVVHLCKAVLAVPVESEFPIH